MDRTYENIINEGKKNGKKVSEINAELEAAGATFRLDYTMSDDGPVTGWTEQEMEEGFILSEEVPEVLPDTPVMKRRVELSNLEVIQKTKHGFYKVTYNEEGYAVKAIKV